jgi:hypothetical protein
LAGLAEDEALALTLEELGAPSLVSRGMIRLYSLPRLLVPLAAALLLVPAATRGQGPDAKLEVLRMGSAPRCDTSTLKLGVSEVPGGLKLRAEHCVVDTGQSWLGLTTLRSLVEGSGASWRELPDGVELRFQGGKPVWFELPIDVPTAYREGVENHAGDSGSLLEAAGMPEPAVIERDGERYLSTAALVLTLAEHSGLEVRLESTSIADEARLRVGGTEIILAGLPDAAVQGVFAELLIRRLLSEPVIDRVAWDLELAERLPESEHHALELPGDAAGALHAVAYRTALGGVRFTLAKPGSGDALEILLPWKQPDWVESAADLVTDRSAMLMRFSGVVSDRAQLYEPIRAVSARP